ncbi:MAG: hypothetical protein AB7O78_02125 [Thermoleophilia bacterium]
MRGYGFTTAEGRGAYDGAAWPPPSPSGPGAWTAAPAPSPLQGRVRAHRIEDLPFAIDEALWVVELDGDVRRERRLTSGARGRLVARIGAWDGACAADYARDCEVRAQERAVDGPDGADGELMRGYLDDLHTCVTGGLPRVTAAGAAGYIGARIAGIAAGPGRYDEGAAAERTTQARWLAARLDLADHPG